MKKKLLCALLTLTMCTGTLPMTAVAAECDHHLTHTENCGYVAAVEGTDCTHEHGEDCYVLAEDCQHAHGDCGYIAAVEGVACDHACGEECLEGCTHVHGDCSYAEAVEGADCTHICDEGCMAEELNCIHEHDADCGWSEAAEGSPCAFECEECNAEEPVEESVDEESSVNIITEWNWNDEAEIISTDGTYATLPQATDWKTLQMVLPASIYATVDGEKVEIPVEWECEDFPAEDEQQGTFELKAVLPEGYALSESIAALKLEVDLGVAASLDTPIDPITVGDFTVTPTNEGSLTDSTDYTYKDGVLTITTTTPVTIGMKEGVTSTAETIVVDSENGEASITFDSIKISTTEDDAISVKGSDKVTFTFTGESTLIAVENAIIAKSTVPLVLTSTDEGSLSISNTKYGIYLDGRTEGGGVAINGDIQLDISNGSINKSYGIYLKNVGDLTISGSPIISIDTYGSAIDAQNITISGGTLKLKNDKYRVIQAADGDTITISGNADIHILKAAGGIDASEDKVDDGNGGEIIVPGKIIITDNAKVKMYGLDAQNDRIGGVSDYPLSTSELTIDGNAVVDVYVDGSGYGFYGDKTVITGNADVDLKIVTTKTSSRQAIRMSNEQPLEISGNATVDIDINGPKVYGLDNSNKGAVNILGSAVVNIKGAYRGIYADYINLSGNSQVSITEDKNYAIYCDDGAFTISDTATVTASSENGAVGFYVKPKVITVTPAAGKVYAITQGDSVDDPVTMYCTTKTDVDNKSSAKYFHAEAMDTVPITEASVSIDAPVKNGTPDTTAEIAQDVNYTVSGVTWSDNPTKFLGGTEYTATLILTAKDGYMFTEGTAVTVEGADVTQTLNNNGTMTVEAKFDETEAAVPLSISIKSNPNKTIYIKGEVFDPAGLAISATNDDGSTADVTYSDSNKDDFSFPEKVTTDTISVEYKGISTTITVTVKAIVTLDVFTPEKSYDGEAMAEEDIEVTAMLNGAEVTGISGYAYQWKDAEGNPLEQAPVNVGSYQLTVSVQDNDANYMGSVTKTVTITKGEPNVGMLYNSIESSGKTLEDAELKLDGNSTPGTLAWVLPETTAVTANTEYEWKFTPEDAANYKEMTGKIILWEKAVSSGGSGGGGSSSSTTVTNKGDSTEIDTSSGTISESNADKAIDKAVENGSDEIIIDTNKDIVTLPEGMTEKIADETDADLVVETKNGTVTIPNSTLEDMDAEGKVTVEVTKDKVTISDEDGELSDIGKIEVTVPYEENSKTGNVAVEVIKADGTKEVIEDVYDGKNSVTFEVDGSVTFEIIDDYVPLADVPVVPEQPADNPFKDVSEKDWFYKAVMFVSENGLMGGVDADNFGPSWNTTRGMITTILWRMEGKPAAGAVPFTDVNVDMYYADAIAWAAAEGIVSGYDAVTFGPEDNITREQLASILFRYAKFKGYDVSVGEDTNILSYEDAFSISEYAIPAMQWACGAGIISGNDDGTLNPGGHAQRAHAAQMLMKFLENVK